MATREHDDLAKAIANVLRARKFKFQQEPAMGGVQPDFVIEHDDGQKTVVEAKSWPSTEKAITRAADQVARYRQLTGADHVLIVLPEGPKRKRIPEVIGLAELGVALDKLRAARSRSMRNPSVRFKRGAKKQERVIFAAMPFQVEYDDVFFVAMVGAAKDLDATCVRVDQEEFVGDIPARIRKEIKRSAAVIADVSGASPNVLYEAGFAHALNKPTVHICCTPLNRMPFDISQQNTLTYNKGQTYQLKGKLVTRLKAIL